MTQPNQTKTLNVIQQMQQEAQEIDKKLAEEIKASENIKRKFDPTTDITKKVAAIELIRILLKQKKLTIIGVIGYVLCFGLGKLPTLYGSIGMYLFVGVGAWSLFNMQKDIRYYKEKYKV